MSGGVDLRALAAEGRPVHFMGIGGAGMCALAELLLRSGAEVSGCDGKDTPALRDLAALGADVRVGHDASHVVSADVLIVTSAVPPEHPELAAARAAGVPVLKRAEALGAWVAAGRVVAVAGTHGKTTTTAMVAQILAEAGLDPTGLVGGKVAGWRSNLRFGSQDLFVVEADEYDRSFHTLAPDVAVVTNLEADHLDVYGDLPGVKAAFAQFVARVPDGGRVVVCADDHGASTLSVRLGGSAYTYGTVAGSMLRATNVSTTPESTRCTVVEDGRPVGLLRLRLGGVHNVLNALGASAAARSLGVPWPVIFGALEGFEGVARRFERLGESRGVSVVDDYAHHPTEVAATLAAARAVYPGRRLVVAFQPHLFSRTRDFAGGFGEALAAADAVRVTGIFPAREAPIPGVTGETVVQAALAAGSSDALYVESLDDVADALAHELRAGDVLLTLGAGSIEALGPAVLGLLAEAVHA